MKNKLIFISQMLVIAWIVQLALFVYGGIYTGHNLFITLVAMGPLAGSAILALFVSEISDQKGKGKNENQIQGNDPENSI